MKNSFFYPPSTLNKKKKEKKSTTPTRQNILFMKIAPYSNTNLVITIFLDITRSLKRKEKKKKKKI